ncbi:MAG: hypothetical protein ACNA75_10080 [Thiohalomonadaceae bacterium]
MKPKTMQGQLKGVGWKSFLAGIVGVSLLLSGCGDGANTSSQLADQEAAKTATVSFTVKFPEAEAQKAVIADYTGGIAIGYCMIPTGDYWCDLFVNDPIMLTSTETSATLNLVPGNYRFEAGALLGDQPLIEDMYDYASTAGQIVEGANTVVMNFLQGTWRFRLEGGALDPITLGNGTVFHGIKLRSFGSYGDEQFGEPTASKANANFELPYGDAYYHGILILDEGEGEVDRFGGPVWVDSQFHSGNTNVSDLMGIDYNLTKGCYYYSEQCYDREAVGDWLLVLMGQYDEQDFYEDYGPYALLPADSGPTYLDGSPVDFAAQTSIVDGSTLRLDFAEVQIQASESILVDTTAQAVAASHDRLVRPDAPRSRQQMLKKALAEQASKSADITTLGTIQDSWYDAVVVATNAAPNYGSWNFDKWVWNSDIGDWEVVENGCLVMDDPSGIIYAEEYCAWLDWVIEGETRSQDPGDFTYGFQPADPNNLGSYTGCYEEFPGVYLPWCFGFDENGNADYGSFYFTHYVEHRETMDNVRVLGVRAQGVQFPEEFAIFPPATEGEDVALIVQ